MKNNEYLDKTNIYLGFVIDRKSKDFSLVPSWTYKRLVEKEIICCDDVIQDITPYEDDDYHLDFWPTCGFFFVIDNGPYQDVALSIGACGLSYDTFYFLPLYKLLVSNGVVHL